jgi:hypothetical protein
MGMFICVDSGEEGIHSASISCTIEGWPVYQGICLRAIIGYLLTLYSKSISHKLLLKEGILDYDVVTPTTTAEDRFTHEKDLVPSYQKRISNALELLRSWVRKKDPCHLRGSLDMDVMRQLAEAHNTSVHFDEIPEECPTVLTELNLSGIYHLLAFPDRDDVEYDESREVVFTLEKVIWYSTNLFRTRVARMGHSADAGKHIGKVEGGRPRLPGFQVADHDEGKDAEDYCREIMNFTSPPFGIGRAKDVEVEEIVEVEVDTIDGRHPGYCMLNDCLEFSYGLKEVFAACEPGDKVTVGGSSEPDF